MSKNVLITGGAGFIAHHIIDRILRTTDWNIVTIDRLDFSGNLNRLADMMQDHDAETRKRVRPVFHDLKAEISPLTSGMIGDINYVLHLAAGSHVDRSIDHPMEFVMDNVVGTVNLLNWARTLPNLERFINFSTDEVLVRHLQGLHTKNTIVTTQVILTLLLKQAQKNCVLHTKTHTRCQSLLPTP